MRSGHVRGAHDQAQHVLPADEADMSEQAARETETKKLLEFSSELPSIVSHKGL